MKKISTVLLFVLVLSFGTAWSQFATPNRCYDGELYEIGAKLPGHQEHRDALEMEVNRWIENNGFKTSQGVITIPVVVHIVYGKDYPEQNVSDARVQSQIDVMNKDFRRLNADASKTPAAFKSLAADMEIEFCLASVDPNGSPTNGITRTQTNYPGFAVPTSLQGLNDDLLKLTKDGGKDAWPTDKYLNIWVARIVVVTGSGPTDYYDLAGYTYPWMAVPENQQNKAMDGVGIHYDVFGVNNPTKPGLAPLNKGRTGTHEVAHWLGLHHLWGPDAGGTCGNDEVSDTPPHQKANFGCPNFPKAAGCAGGSPNGEMFMNYMDYTDDVCMNMFTMGQKQRVIGMLNTSLRKGILTSTACGAAPVADAGIISITTPNGSLDCSGIVQPVVVLKNYGTATLKSVNIKYQIDAGAEQNFAWSGNLAAGGTENVSLSTFTGLKGGHTYSARTDAPNGITDNNKANDKKTANFSCLATTGILSRSENPGIEAFPNPTSGKLYIGLGEHVTNARIVIADLSGKLVMTRVISGENVEFDLTSMENGIYFVRIQAKDNLFYEKVILSK